MSNGIKKWLVLAGILVIVGSAIFAAVLALAKFDFQKFNTRKIVTNTYEISEDFANISVDTLTADIIFVPSEDGKCRVECREREKLSHSAEVINGALTVKAQDSRRWYDHIGFFIGKTEVKIYLPKSDYAALNIETDTGNISMPENFTFESITADTDTGNINSKAVSVNTVKISTDTGNIKLLNTRCIALSVESETGNVHLENVIAGDNLSIQTDTGNVRFKSCDAGEIYIETDTGNVEGSLLSAKIFFTESDTGNISVPKTETGGQCKITTDTGNIKIIIA